MVVSRWPSSRWPTSSLRCSISREMAGGIGVHEHNALLFSAGPLTLTSIRSWSSHSWHRTG